MDFPFNYMFHETIVYFIGVLYLGTIFRTKMGLFSCWHLLSASRKAETTGQTETTSETTEE